MQHNPLSELPLLALTRSDRVMDICLKHLLEGANSDNKKFTDKLHQSMRETLFDIRAHQIRWDDIDQLLSNHWQPKKGGYHLDSLFKAAQYYLRFRGNHISVKTNKCIEYQAIINRIHPAFLIAAQFVEQVRNRRISINALPSLLQHQCPLGFARNDENTTYADNHVHFGGIHGAEVLTQLLFAQLDRAKLEKMNLPRVPEFTLINNEYYTPSKLISAYRLLFATFCSLCFESDQEQNSSLSLLPHQLKATLHSSPFRQGGSKIYNQAQLRSKSPETPQQTALFEMVKQAKQGNAQQAMLAFAAALLLQSNEKKAPSKLTTITLTLIHLVNILRAYVVMSGVGLTQFIDFFRSDIRLFNRNKGDRQALRWLLGGNNKAALKTAPPNKDLNYLADIAKQAIKLKKDPKTLDQHLHYCLHFSRNGKDMDHTKAVNKKSHDIRIQTYILERLLKSQIKHIISDKRDRLRLGNKAQKTLRVPPLVRGFDVAGNENHFQINVFAPALRYLREKPLTIKGLDGIEHLVEQRYLSIHAGEDFSHLITGLRHIDETVRYCNMRHGDRIGHALALGVDPATWAQRQEQAVVPLEQDLWNTLWLHHYAVKLSPHHHEARLMVHHYEEQLNKIQLELFKSPFTLKQLWNYWQARGNSDLHEKWTRDSDYFDDRQYWVNFEVDEKLREHHFAIQLALKKSRPINKLKEKKVTVLLQQKAQLHQLPSTGSDPLTRHLHQSELTFYQLLQDHLMMKYDHQGITLEVCPSSNISLGRFEDYHEHPVFRWYPPDESLFEKNQWDKFGIRQNDAVSVCINTDDPGIFPTKIEQEYHLLANAAKQHYGLSSQTTDFWIERLRKMSLRQFRS